MKTHDLLIFALYIYVYIQFFVYSCVKTMESTVTGVSMAIGSRILLENPSRIRW